MYLFCFKWLILAYNFCILSIAFNYVPCVGAYVLQSISLARENQHPFHTKNSNRHHIIESHKKIRRLSNTKSDEEQLNLNTSVQSRYYSLTSRKVWLQKIVPLTLLLSLLRIIIENALSTPSSMPSLQCHANGPISQIFLVRNIFLPTLASSCCLIQLIINTFAGIGCVGFNSILGPLRPLLVSMQLFLTISSVITREFNMTWLIMSWTLTFTPEIVGFLNIKKRNTSQKEFVVTVDDTEKIKVIDLYVTDMGCVACINKIESTVRKSYPNDMLRIESRLNDSRKGGQVRLFFKSSSTQTAKIISKEVISLIHGAGFDCDYMKPTMM